MPYENDPERIRRQADLLYQINMAAIKGDGRIGVRLGDGRTIEGRYYSLHCTASNQGKIACTLMFGDVESEDDMPFAVDLLDIVTVEPKGRGSDNAS